WAVFTTFCAAYPQSILYILVAAWVLKRDDVLFPATILISILSPCKIPPADVIRYTWAIPGRLLSGYRAFCTRSGALVRSLLMAVLPLTRASSTSANPFSHA